MKERRERRWKEGIKGAGGRERVRERILSQMQQNINNRNYCIVLELSCKSEIISKKENKKESRIYVHKEWLKYLLRK